MIKIYGIKNCNTMKKTFDWLDAKNVAYTFHDYKKQGADQDVLEKAFVRFGWENVINRNGTTWRKLPETVRARMTEKSALTAALENPSLIKRPLILARRKMALGFDEDFLKTLV